jgi:hypothetical protein
VSAPVATMLTVDLESDWGGPSHRGVDEVLPRLLDLFEAEGARAVFFVVGTLARHRSAAVRGLSERGHVVASHGMTHAKLGRCSEPQQRAELRDSRRALEDVTGRACTGFRAPFFDLPRGFGPVLEREGYRWSSSKAPFSSAALYRWVTAREAHVLDGSTVREHPVSSLLGLPIPAGLSYVRLFWPLTSLVRSPPAVFYLHPYELLEDASEFALGRGVRPFMVTRRGAWASERLATMLAAFRAAKTRWVVPDDAGALV